MSTVIEKVATDPRFGQAFPSLDEAQIRDFARYGKKVRFSKGDVIWPAGVVDMCMYVVVSGEMDIVNGRTGAFIAKHVPGSFSGDIDILSGRASIVSAVAATDLELVEVPADCVRSIVGEQPRLGEIILRAFLMRRALLIESQAIGPMVVGSGYSLETLRIREFLGRNHYPVVWEDIESNPATAQMLKEFEVTEEQTPLVVLPDGRFLTNPTNSELAEALGIKRPVESKIYDLVIIGAGPAGLAAAVYGASEGLQTLVVDAIGPGGQAGTSSKIENYMGFPLGITGQELADGALVQAEKFGAQMVVPGVVTSISCNAIAGHGITIEGMDPVDCRCVILACGAQYRRLEVDALDKYEGNGIYYAATHIERVLCGSSCIAVVGAGNSAGQAATFMAENAAQVLLIVRGDNLRKTMSSYLARRIEQSEKIEVLLESEIIALQGERHLEEITIVNRKTNKERKEEVTGVFVMIGAMPQTDWLPDSIARDEKGFIKTGPQLVPQGLWHSQRPPYFLETSCPGVYAVGDARANSIKRVASAVGEGAMAVSFVHQFLAT